MTYACPGGSDARTAAEKPDTRTPHLVTHAHAWLQEYRSFRPLAYNQTEEETETLGELGDVNALLRRTIQKSQDEGGSDEAMSTALRQAILAIQAKNEAKDADAAQKAIEPPAGSD